MVTVKVTISRGAEREHGVILGCKHDGEGEGGSESEGGGEAAEWHASEPRFEEPRVER